MSNRFLSFLPPRTCLSSRIDLWWWVTVCWYTLESTKARRALLQSGGLLRAYHAYLEPASPTHIVHIVFPISSINTSRGIYGPPFTIQYIFYISINEQIKRTVAQDLTSLGFFFLNDEQQPYYENPIISHNNLSRQKIRLSRSFCFKPYNSLFFIFYKD